MTSWYCVELWRVLLAIWVMAASNVLAYYGGLSRKRYAIALSAGFYVVGLLLLLIPTTAGGGGR